MIARATADLSAFNLDFHGFALGDITVADTSATSRRSGHELTITPAQPLRQGETFTTTIAYSGVPTPVRSVALPVEVGWNKYADGSYVASEPEGAATWFPVNDHPRDKASYTFRISVPKPYVAAANGVLADTIDHGATRTYVWQMGRPMASYLATVNIGKFVMKTETGPDGLPIRNFFPPRIERQATKAFGRTSEMIRYFSTLFGPFPFETYGVVAPDVELGFALETQTLSIFGRDQVEQIAEDGNDQEVAHEITHQWYGDSVSLASWQDVWLNEGFATFGEWLWVEHTSGRGAYDAAVRDAYSGADPADVPPPGNPPPDNLFNSGVYGRGALTLAALRLRVGDDLFFRIMRAYAERFRYGNATTAGFIAVAQQVSGRDLKTFFDEWLYRRPLPAIPELGLRAG
jgi:aminopeptidase N